MAYTKKHYIRMHVQQIVNSIFRQDFKDPLVLGRVLFGLAILVIGVMNISQPSHFAEFAPDYIPVPLAAAEFVGTYFTVTGFAILASLRVVRAARLLAIIFGAFIIIVDLPQGNILDLATRLALVSTTLIFMKVFDNSVPWKTPVKEQTDVPAPAQRNI